jgi:hypothetical protein
MHRDGHWAEMWKTHRDTERGRNNKQRNIKSDIIDIHTSYIKKPSSCDSCVKVVYLILE